MGLLCDGERKMHEGGTVLHLKKMSLANQVVFQEKIQGSQGGDVINEIT